MKRYRYALLALTLVVGNASADNWPMWRGLKNDGISQEKGLPTEWSATKNVVWSLPLPGMGNSTPCVWGDRIFLTSEDGKDLVALGVNTAGKQLWKKTLGQTTPKARSDEGNGASASPSTDGKHVWFFVGSSELACLDFDGNEVWKFNTQERYGEFRIMFGMHSTPVLHDGHLYLQFMHDGGQWVIALEAATGKEIWKVNRPSDGRSECLHSYASAFMWTSGNEAYLVTHGNDYTVAHDLKDGHEIWRLGELNGKGNNYIPSLRFVASPVCTPDLIVVPSAKGGPVVAVKPNSKGKIGAGSEHEQWRKTRDTPDVPCPLVFDGLVYLAREDGFLICLDAKTGEEVYPKQRLHDQRHRASPVVADGKVYITSRDGTTSVVKAGREFELLAKNRLPESMSASPAIADGRIYIRGFKNLYAIGTK